MSLAAPLAVVIPLFVAGLLACLGERLAPVRGEAVAAAAALGSLVMCVSLLVRTGGRSDPLVYWMGGWHPRHGIAVGVSFAVDPIGAGLAAFIALLMVAGLVYAWNWEDEGDPHFPVMMLVFLAGMIGFCLSGDLFNMFVWFELMSVAAFALAAHKIDVAASFEGSLAFAVTNTIGSFLIVSGIALVYARTGALNLAQMGHALAGSQADGLVVVAFALLATGLLVKAAVVPFHFWLADAYAVSPTAVCILFAGAMSELGIYGVGRIWFDAFAGALGPHAPALRTALIAFGVATALVGAILAWEQDHLKRMLAFATISYVGVFLIGLGLLDEAGVAAAAVYVVADGFVKAALFAAAGILENRTGSVSELRLRGFGRPLWPAGVVMAIGAAAMAGVPGSGSFLGKSMLEDALIETGRGWLVAVLVVASILSGGAVLRAAGRIFLGLGGGEDERRRGTAHGQAPRRKGKQVVPRRLLVPSAALLAAGVAIGVVPGALHAAHAAAGRFASEPGVAKGPGLRDFAFAIVATAGAVGLAWAALDNRLERRARRLVRVWEGAVAPLRDLHSGHIGDYVAWLVVGSATLGGAFALALA